MKEQAHGLLYWLFTGGAALMLLVALAMVISAVQIVRPVEVRLVERFGKYARTLDPGFHFLVPVMEQARSVNLTEIMVDVEPQTVITKDKLNVEVDAIVYYKVMDPIKASYNVNDCESQLIALAKTTLRAVIGQMTLTEANENRAHINNKIEEILDKETNNYGVDVLRVEIQKVHPPQDVIQAMNAVVKAEQSKIAAKELALAAQETANGERMAAMQKAEGEKQARILQAEGLAAAKTLQSTADAKAIEVVSEATNKYFKENAQLFKKLETVQQALSANTKIIIPTGTSLVNFIGDLAGLSADE